MRAVTCQHSSTVSGYVSKTVSFVTAAIIYVAAVAVFNDAAVAVISVAALAAVNAGVQLDGDLGKIVAILPYIGLGWEST